jgi:ornithine carbamoyltransferase
MPQGSRPPPMPGPAAKRDFLSITDLAAELPALLVRASALKAARRRGDLTPSRPGIRVVLIFEKPSTRTRTSFEVGIADLGGHPIYYPAKEMQLGRGETIADTARVLSRYADAIVYRAFRHADVEELARHASIPVVNALDDLEHPCQVVADLQTLSECWPQGFGGRRLAYVGDGNNVLHSLLLGCAAVGLDLSTASPEAYQPEASIIESARRLARRTGATLAIGVDPKAAVAGADAVYTDVWVSMGDEAEAAARERAFQGYQLNAALLALAKPTACVLHDLPAHRGSEITDEVMDGPRSVIWDQAENRLHAQKAILEALIPPRRSGPAA